MILSQITLSENFTYGIISSLALTVLSMVLYIFKNNTDSTKARIDSRKSEDDAHVREMSSLRDRMITAEAELRFLRSEAKETKMILKENYEKLDSKLEQILSRVNRP